MIPGSWRRFWRADSRGRWRRKRSRKSWRRLPSGKAGSDFLGSRRGPRRSAPAEWPGRCRSFSLITSSARSNRNNGFRSLDAYWRGVLSVLPDLAQDPGNYMLQKAMGVLVMHKVLISVLEYLRSVGKSLIEPASYEEAMREALLSLRGGHGREACASGVDFWRSGPEGAAGSFSSNAGRRVLTARLPGLLPKPEVA